MLLFYKKKKYERFHVNGHTTGLHVHLMKKYKSFKFSPLTTMQRLLVLPANENAINS